MFIFARIIVTCRLIIEGLGRNLRDTRGATNVCTYGCRFPRREGGLTTQPWTHEIDPASRLTPAVRETGPAMEAREILLRGRCVWDALSRGRSFRDLSQSSDNKSSCYADTLLGHQNPREIKERYLKSLNMSSSTFSLCFFFQTSVESQNYWIFNAYWENNCYCLDSANGISNDGRVKSRDR